MFYKVQPEVALVDRSKNAKYFLINKPLDYNYNFLDANYLATSVRNNEWFDTTYKFSIEIHFKVNVRFMQKSKTSMYTFTFGLKFKFPYTLLLHS